MESINQLFNQLVISAHPEWVDNWKINCLRFVKDVSQLRRTILANPESNIENESLYENLSNPTIQSYKSFMLKWLKTKDNGIASRGQSVLSSIDFEIIIADKEFKTIAKQVIINPSLETYNLLTNWWSNNDKISYRPLLINRALATCKPENISTTTDNKKFWKIVGRLQSDFGFQFQVDPLKNWYSANEQLTSWLDNKLSSELNQISTDSLEKIIWRNIFVWLLYLKFETLKDLKPNSLTRKEKPRGGLEKMPEFIPTFRGVIIDFIAKAKDEKDLGDEGEELVKQYEIKYLISIGKIEEANKVDIMIDGIGYDILSFDANGNEKYIEVKTTTGDQDTPFFLSDREFSFLKLNKDKYSIYRVYNYNDDFNSAEFFELKGDVEAQLIMKPKNYTVYLKKEESVFYHDK